MTAPAIDAPQPGTPEGDAWSDLWEWLDANVPMPTDLKPTEAQR